MRALAYILSLFFLSVPALGQIPPSAEPEFAKAILDFRDGKYREAIQRINRLPKEVQNETEVLELKAIAFRRDAKWKESEALYRQLLNTAIRQKQDSRSYQFELGVIAFEQNQLAKANNYFKRTAQSGFNPIPSAYFLGLIAFQQGRLSEAEDYFHEVTDSSVRSLSALANLYLGQILGRTNRHLASLKRYSLASEKAVEEINDPNVSEMDKKISRQIVNSVDTVVSSLKEMRPGANVGLVTAYDSNVLFTANGLTTPAEGPSGRGSFHQILQYGLGLETSPLEEWQLIANFQGSFDYHYNRGAQQGDTLNNDLSLFVTKDPLKRLSYGAKIGVFGAFQNTLDTSSGAFRYRTYSLGGNVGPFLQYSVTDDLRAGVEVFYQPRRLFLDSTTTAAFQQTGAVYLSRIYLRKDTGTGLFNPSVYLTGRISHTRGVEFRSRGWNIDFANRFYLSDQSMLGSFLSVGSSGFTERQGRDRFDVPASLGINYLYRMTANLDLIGDLIYTYQFSNVDNPYEYNRYQLAISGNYRF